MRRALYCVLLLAAPLLAAGCSNQQKIIGPVQAHEIGPAENPYYPKSIWPTRDRERSSRPEDNKLEPDVYISRPSPTGR